MNKTRQRTKPKYDMTLIVDIGLYGESVDECKRNAVELAEKIFKTETDQIIRTVDVLERYTYCL